MPGETRKDAELTCRHDSRMAEALEGRPADAVSGFGDRVVPIHATVAGQLGRTSAIRSVPVIDALLTATAKACGLTLVTRNAADVAGLGVDVLNPFEAEGSADHGRRVPAPCSSRTRRHQPRIILFAFRANMV